MVISSAQPSETARRDGVEHRTGVVALRGVPACTPRGASLWAVGGRTRSGRPVFVSVASVADLSTYGLLTAIEQQEQRDKMLTRFANMYGPAVGTGQVMEYLGQTGLDSHPVLSGLPRPAFVAIVWQRLLPPRRGPRPASKLREDYADRKSALARKRFQGAEQLADKGSCSAARTAFKEGQTARWAAATRFGCGDHSGFDTASDAISARAAVRQCRGRR